MNKGNRTITIGLSGTFVGVGFGIGAAFIRALFPNSFLSPCFLLLAIIIISLSVIPIKANYRKNKKERRVLVENEADDTRISHIENVKVCCPKCLTAQIVSGTRPFEVSCKNCAVSLMIPKKTSDGGGITVTKPISANSEVHEAVKVQCPGCMTSQIVHVDRRPFQVSCSNCGITLIIPQRSRTELDYNEGIKYPPEGVETLIVTSLDIGSMGENSLRITCPKCKYMQIAVMREPYIVQCDHCGSWLELPGIP